MPKSGVTQKHTAVPSRVVTTPKQRVEGMADVDTSSPIVEAAPNPPQQSSRWHKWFAVVAGLVVGAIILLVGAWYVSSRDAGSPLGPTSDTPTPTPEPEEPSFTIAAVGYGGAGHDGSYLTDSILVVRFLLEQKRVVVLSVPRDIWVEIPVDGEATQFSKINAVYSVHGPDAFKASLSQVTGWQVDRYFGVDFSGFTKAIDSLGGIELNVERSFDDYEYPIPGRERLVCEEMKDESGAVIATPEPMPDDGIISVWDEIESGAVVRDDLPENVKNYPCRYEHVSFQAGRQTLTGTQALKYARSRHAPQDGNDFNRARRQQNLVLAGVAQVFQLDFIPKIPSLISTLRSHIATDLTTFEIAEWLAKANEVRSWPVSNLVPTDKNYLSLGTSPDRQSILMPKAGLLQWQALHDWLAYVSKPAAALHSPVIEIQAPTAELVTANEWSARVATSSALPVILAAPTTARSASASAVVLPLVPRIDPAVLQQLQTDWNATLDESQVSTSGAQLNGPHVRILWR